MELRPGYKQTEVGVIPEDWGTKPCSALSDLITVGIVVRPTQYYVEQGVPAFRSANIGEDGINGTDLVFISPESNARLAKSQVRAGDVVTVRTGYPGTSAVVPREYAGSNCIDILITRPSKTLISEYLAAWINSPHGKNQVLRNQGGLAQQHFNVSDLRNLLVALPPLPEQRGIAAVLGDVDALLGALEKLIAKKRDLKQAAMQQLLTGQKRLPGFSGEWEVQKLSDLLDFRNGANADKHAYGKGVPFINVLEVITKAHLRSSDIPGRVLLPRSSIDSFAVRRGDILFNRTSETQEEVGLASVYMDDETVVFGGFVIRGRPMGTCTDATYSGYAFRAPFVRSQIIAKGQGAIRANIGQAELGQVLAPLPPLPEQAAIAAVLSDMDAEIAALDARLAKTRALKQGMLQELLTGKTRLI